MPVFASAGLPAIFQDGICDLFVGVVIPFVSKLSLLKILVSFKSTGSTAGTKGGSEGEILADGDKDSEAL